MYRPGHGLLLRPPAALARRDQVAPGGRPPVAPGRDRNELPVIPISADTNIPNTRYTWRQLSEAFTPRQIRRRDAVAMQGVHAVANFDESRGFEILGSTFRHNPIVHPERYRTLNTLVRALANNEAISTTALTDGFGDFLQNFFLRDIDSIIDGTLYDGNSTESNFFYNLTRAQREQMKQNMRNLLTVSTFLSNRIVGRVNIRNGTLFLYMWLFTKFLKNLGYQKIATQILLVTIYDSVTAYNAGEHLTCFKGMYERFYLTIGSELATARPLAEAQASEARQRAQPVSPERQRELIQEWYTQWARNRTTGLYEQEFVAYVRQQVQAMPTERLDQWDVNGLVSGLIQGYGGFNPFNTQPRIGGTRRTKRKCKNRA